MLGFRKTSFNLSQQPKIQSLVDTVALGNFALSRVIDNPNAYSTALSDSFGQAVAMSENYLIVGVPAEDDAGGTSSGKAYVYNLNTGALLHTLDNPNAYSTSASDNFAQAVAITDSYAIASAALEDDAAGASAGKVYVFSTSTGSLVHTISNPNAYGTTPGDQFGVSIAAHGNYLIVGANGEGDAGGTSSGKAYVFNLTSAELIYTFDNPNAYDTSAGDSFGQSVGISSNYAIVGAHAEDDAGGTSSGKAYVFSMSTGSLVYTLNNPNAYDTSANDFFGLSVGITDTYAIVGAYGEDDSGGGQSGKAYVFSMADGSLLYTLDNPNAYSTSAADSFANYLAISGNYALVSAQNEDDAGGTSSGKAYVFSMSDGSLSQTLDNPNAFTLIANDLFGYKPAISGNRMAIGAYFEDDAAGLNSGKVYVYSRIISEHLTTPYQSGLAYTTLSATSISSTIIVPSTAQVGDIAILADFSTTVTDTTPTNWTPISGVTTSGIRTNVSYKILASDDLGATITGMAGTTRKIMAVFRLIGNTAPSISLSTPSAQATTSAPTNQTITAGSGNSIYCAVYAKNTSTTPTITFTQTGKGSTNLTSVSTSGVYMRFTTYSAGTNAETHNTATVTMTDAGTNSLQSFRMDIT